MSAMNVMKKGDSALSGRARRGFSIAEVIMGLFVASLVVLGVLSAISTTLDLNKKDYELTKAQSLCRKLLESTVDYAGQSNANFQALVNGTAYHSGYSWIQLYWNPSTSSYVNDDTFVYKEDIVPCTSTLGQVTITIYYAASGGVPNPDLTNHAVNSARILQMSTFIRQGM
jgi:Tfp pilus assembly protein PilV